MNTADNPRETAIHQSANRPNLLLGGDRELVLVMVMIAGGLAFSLASWWGIGLAVALWIGSMAALQRMGKADPLLRPVYLRHIRYTAYLSGEERSSRSEYRDARELEVTPECRLHNIDRELGDWLICCCHSLSLRTAYFSSRTAHCLPAGRIEVPTCIPPPTRRCTLSRCGSIRFSGWAVAGCLTRTSSAPAHLAIRIRALFLTP